MPVEGRGGGGGRPMCCAGADAGWRGGGGIWYMAAWWAKAYEGLEGPLGVGGGAPCCAAMRCEGSTGRAANGRLARSDSTAEPQGELAKHSGRGRGRGRAGGGRFGRKRQRGGAGAARLSCAGVCGRWVRCEGAAQGITAWRGRRIERIVSARPGRTAEKVWVEDGVLRREVHEPDLLQQPDAGRSDDAAIAELRALRRRRGG